MYSVILKTLAVMSAAGGLTALLLIAFKRLNKRLFGAKWQYYAYAAAVIIMLVPLHISLPETYDAPTSAPETAASVQDIYSAASSVDAPEPAVPAEAPVLERTLIARGRMRIGTAQLLVYIWLAGAVIFIGGGIVSYIRFLAAIRRSSHEIPCPELETAKAALGVKRKIQVRQTTLLNAPMLVGIIRPIMLLPCKEISKRELGYILLHELTHYKRHDLLYKWIVMAANGIHWFNPIAYLLSAQINEECEISCDLDAVKDMTGQEKKEYMNTILKLTQKG